MKRNDVLLIALFALIALAAWVWARALPRPAAGEALITQNGAAATLALSRDETLTLTGDAGQVNVIQISGGRARMLSANCPDQRCVRQGEISRAGQTIVCLPGRVVITLRGVRSPGPDAPGETPNPAEKIDILAE